MLVGDVVEWRVNVSMGEFQCGYGNGDGIKNDFCGQ